MKTFADYQADGMIPEDVINVLYDPSVITLPVTGAIDHIGATSSLKEFNDKTLRTPDKDNAIIDGAAASADDTSSGIRYVQPMQLQEAGINLGDQAQASDSFGGIADFAQQLEDRTNELRRDTEANFCSANASVLPVTNTVAGKAAGFFAQLASATNHGVGGSAGGWNAGTGVFDAPTAGTTRALSEGNLLDVMEVANNNGAELDLMFMISSLKRKFSGFMMSSSSRVGALVTQAPGGEGGATAVQSVMLYETDFGVVKVVNNRIMQPENAGVGTERTNLGIMQTNMAACVDQWTPRAKRLGPAGAGESWQVTSSRGGILRTERAHAGVFDIDYTQDMTQ